MKLRTATLPRHLLAAFGVVALLGAIAPEAEACGGGWFPEVEIDHRVQGIAWAEGDLKKGDYKTAAGKVIRMMPHIRAYAKTTSDPIVNRAMRVLAVATARSNGKLDIAAQLPKEMRGQWLGEKAEDRSANLAWSVRTLRAIDSWKKNDPTVQTELGEALAKVDAHRGEARDLLGKLATKDLMAGPEGYAALAALRSEAGDRTGHDAALKRCQAMAKKPSMCASSGLLSQS